MTHALSLGAINKDTGEYVYPKKANKKHKYICPCCKKEVFPRQGKVLRPHFAHKSSDNPCNYYNHPGETEIHLDGKLLMKKLLEEKVPISLVRTCPCCKKDTHFSIPEIGEGSIIKTEHPIKFNGNKFLDVAYIEDGELFIIFEICKTHKTCNEDRPNNIEWFEIDAVTLISLANDKDFTSLLIPCMRLENCDDCIEKDKIQQEQIRVNQMKNARNLIGGFNKIDFIYLNVDFSKKDFIKKLGGKWNKKCKLWYISHDKYEKHKKILESYKIIWICKRCGDYIDEDFMTCTDCMYLYNMD